ncbi:histidine kinase, partial [Streptomyces sp. NPDC059101]
AGGAGGPADTGQFDSGRFETTGQFPRPDADTGQFEAGQFDTGQFDTGQFESGAFGTGQRETTGQFPRPSADTGQFPRPDSDTGQFDTGTFETTGQFPRPEGERAEPAGQGWRSAAGRGAAGQDPLGADPLGNGPLGAADSGAGDGRTPIFDTIESNWFNTPASAAAGVPPLPRRDAGQDGAAPGDTPAGGVPTGRAPAGGSREGAPADAAAQWRTSPNDDTWRQAEQIRQPASGGITTSGLPRRVPRANLVAGTAQQQAPQGGPQVSRAPSDVRGRLTNLRRGIQQGRQAGTSSTGTHGIVDPSHQQER